MYKSLKLLAAGGALLPLSREELEDEALCSFCLEDAEMLHSLLAKSGEAAAAQL